MSEQRAIATTNPAPPADLAEVRANRPAPLPSAADLSHLLNLGEMLVKSGLLPQSVRTREAAATIVLKGHELGLPPMAAMEGIAVVQGKAVIGAHLLLALVKRAYGPGAIWVSETTNERCTISYRVPGVPQVLSYAFTIEDARRAGLLDKQTWKSYPAAMLRARAISAAVKLAFPEVVGGLYVAGELPGTQEFVTDDGDVVIDHGTGEIVAERPRPERRPAPQPQLAPPAEADEADPDAMSPAQRRKIFAVARELGLKPDEAKARLKEWTGVESTTRLTGEQAAFVIDKFEALLDARSAGEQEADDAEAGVIDAEFAPAGLPLDAPAAGEPGDDRWAR